MTSRALLAAASLWAAFGMAVAAGPSTELHGNADTFAAPGVVLAWAVQRGADEATTTVVVRVATDAQRYPWLALTGIDPFTQAEAVLLPLTANTGVQDIRIPRARFADTPRTELRLFSAAPAASSIAAPPALTIFYHGVPDTTPEFADAAKLDAHLAARIAALRAAGGLKP